jgi:hypothetical protein
MPAQLTADDDKILRAVVDWNLLTPTEVQKLAGGRHIVSIRRRLQTLGHDPRKRGAWTTKGLGYLRVIDPPEERFGERIWYPDQKAFNHAYEHGWISQPVRAVDRKRSNNKLVHDRLVVAYRFGVHAAYGERLHWTGQYYNLYERWGKAENDHIYADGFFYIDAGKEHPSFFVELENTQEHHYDIERGVSARVKKAEAYVAYFDRGLFQEKFRYPDFRVVFIVSTARKAENFAKKLHKMGGTLDSRRFWITDYDSMLSGADRIYVTPRDFETARYSLEDAARG